MRYGYCSPDIINNQVNSYCSTAVLRLSNSSVTGSCEPYVPTSDSYPGPRLGTHVHWAVGSLKPSAEVGLLTRTSLSSDAKSAASVQNVAKFRSKVEGSNIDPVRIISYMWITVCTLMLLCKIQEQGPA